MKVQTMAMTIILAGTAQLANAQELLPASSYVQPAAWAVTKSPYAAAAGDVDSKFRNRTDKQTSFSPRGFTTRIGQQLDTRLDQQLRRQLQEGERQNKAKVGAN